MVASVYGEVPRSLRLPFMLDAAPLNADQPFNIS
jgi:hypothetical protein